MAGRIFSIISRSKLVCTITLLFTILSCINLSTALRRPGMTSLILENSRLSEINIYIYTELAIVIIFAIVITFIFFRLQHKSLIELETKDHLLEMFKKEIEKLNKSAGSLKNLYNSAVEYSNLKTEFFSNMYHELKTPLTVIIGAIQLMEQTPVSAASEPKKPCRQIQTIKQNCFRLLRLINNILDITKIESGYIKLHPVNCNIVYLIEEITQSVLPYSERKGLILEFDTEEEEIITAVDIDKIERIMLNLLSNAIKFTTTGGKVTVNVYKRNGNVYISVKDTGPGIPKSMQPLIFERFHQVNSSLTRSEGTGIGLSIVKCFVEIHNGSITLNSQEGEGSEFLLELPVRLCECGPDGENGIKTDRQGKIIDSISIEFSDIYSTAS